MPENFEHTKEKLKGLQSLPLEKKVQITATRIIEWYEHYDGMVYVSFSGGKDSTVLLDIARKIYPDIPAVYIDTGLEYPELRQFVKTIPNVIWLKPSMNFRQVIEKYGYPLPTKEQAAFIQECRTTKSEKLRNIRLNGNKYGRGKISARWKNIIDAPFMVSDKCCDIMKKRPAKEYEKKSRRKPIVGTMAEESKQRESNWLIYGCNAFNKDRPTSNPLSFWTEQDVLEYIHTKNIHYAQVYGDIILSDKGYKTTLCDRTGCVFCGFGCHLEKPVNRFQRLKQTHPKLWEYCMKPWDEHGLGMKEVLDYIGVPTE